MSNRSTIVGRVLPRFPINVIGVGGIEIHKLHGNYTFALNPFYPLGDAPYDDFVYGRTSGTWAQAVTLSQYATEQAAQDALIAGKASANHTHTISQITDFGEGVDDKVATLLKPGANIALTYDDAANTLTIAQTGGSTVVEAPTDGDVYARRGSDHSWRRALAQDLLPVIATSGVGNLVIEATSDTHLTFKYQGSDGIVRVFEMPLAVGTPPYSPSMDFGVEQNSMFVALMEDF